MRKDKILFDLKSLSTALDDVCCSTQEIAEALSLAMSAIQPLTPNEYFRLIHEPEHELTDI